MAPFYIMMTGPLLVGALISYFLFGAFFIQAFTYYSDFAMRDKKPFVGLVMIVSVMEVLHLVLSTHTTYTILALGYGDLASLTLGPWSGSLLPALNGAVACCTQLFFAWRVKRLGKNKFSLFCAALITLLALMQWAAAIAVTVQFFRLNRQIDLLKTLNRTVVVWLAGTLACDVVMSLAVIIVMMYYKRSTSYEKSKTMIDSFIAHTIENGLVTTACAALNLIFFLVYPGNFLYVCVEFILGRLYANVLMATLNRRDRSRITGQSESRSIPTGEFGSNQVPLSNLRSFKPHGRPISAIHPKPFQGGVSITREVEIEDGFSNHHDKLEDHKETIIRDI